MSMDISTVDPLTAPLLPVGKSQRQWGVEQESEPQSEEDSHKRSEKRSERPYFESYSESGHGRSDRNLDVLTGANNRAAFDATLTTLVQRQQPFYLALLNLCQLQLYNVQRGHTHGDQLLIQVAQMIELRLPPGSCLFRLRGGEFAVLLPGMDLTWPAALESLKRMQQEISKISLPPFVPPKSKNKGLIQRDRVIHEARLSIGVGRYPEDGLSATEMVESTSQVLRMVQLLCPGKLCVYNSSIAEFLTSHGHL